MFELDGLTVPARLEPLSLRWEQPALVALVGPNGSGKSTLLHAISGLLPAQGSVRIGQRDLLRLPIHEQAQLRAMLPQRLAHPMPVPVQEVLDLGISVCGRSLHHVTPYRDKLVTRLDLWPLLARDFSALSGGEQQRVLIAKTLLQIWPGLNPTARLLLLDEPLAGLDWHHQLQLLSLLRELVQGGIHVICALHDFNLALGHADALVCLQQGQLARAGEMSLLDDALLAEVFKVQSIKLQANGRQLYLPIGVTD